MDYQENLFKDQMAKIQKDIEEKENKYEDLLQEERAKAKQFLVSSRSNEQCLVSSRSNEEQTQREEKVRRFIYSQVKAVAEFEAKRDKLVRIYLDKKVELKRKYLEKDVEQEKAFNLTLTKLLEKFPPSASETSSSSS